MYEETATVVDSDQSGLAQLVGLMLETSSVMSIAKHYSLTTPEEVLSVNMELADQRVTELKLMR